MMDELVIHGHLVFFPFPFPFRRAVNATKSASKNCNLEAEAKAALLKSVVQRSPTPPRLPPPLPPLLGFALLTLRSRELSFQHWSHAFLLLLKLLFKRKRKDQPNSPI